MKVQNITDIDKFFKVVDSCKGKVELVTGEGDRLNLKSKLSQMISFLSTYPWQISFPTARFRSWRLSLTRRKISIN